MISCATRAESFQLALESKRVLLEGTGIFDEPPHRCSADRHDHREKTYVDEVCSIVRRGDERGGRGKVHIK